MSKEYKSKEKKHNKMTKDGLIEQSAVTGAEVNISERESDYELRNERLDNGRVRFGRKRDRKSAREARKSKKIRQQQLHQPPESRQDISESELPAQSEVIRGDDKPLEAAKPEQRTLEARSREIPAGSSERRDRANKPQKSP